MDQSGTSRERSHLPDEVHSDLGRWFVYLESSPTLSSFYAPASETKNTMVLFKVLSLHLISIAVRATRRRKKRLTDEHISKMAFKKASLKA